jgi:hypothetical protein
MQYSETLLAQLVDMAHEDARPALRRRIEAALGEQRGEYGKGETMAQRFLKDLNIYVNMPGKEFMYTRGIAETLRVGEDIFELAYAMKRAMP